MERREELENIFNQIKEKNIKELCLPLVDEVIYLEEELIKIKKLPFIKVHPTDSTMQKVLPAQKIYVSLLAQYNGLIKTLSSVLVDNGAKDVSPLRTYFEKLHGR